MKWAGIIVAGLMTLAIAVAVAGALLPQNHVATRAARYQQPPEVIWRAITDYQKFPSWRSGVTSAEALPGKNGLPAWREVDQHGQVLPMEVGEWTPPTRMVTRIAASKLPFGGTWTYEIQPDQGGSMLRITEHGEIYNPIFRFMARFVLGYTTTMETYLTSLGKKFGEGVAVRN